MEPIVRSPDLLKIAVTDTFDSLIWTDRYNTYGDFVLMVGASPSALGSLVEGHYLSINESDHSMIIESIELVTDDEEGDKFKVSGRSLESILKRRIIWNPTVLNGGFQSQIKKLLDENAIDPTDAERKITKLIFESSEDETIVSSQVNGQFMGENLYDVISGLCLSFDFGFKITLNADSKFVFKLYKGTDRSYDQNEVPFVAFSNQLDNLSKTTYFSSSIPLRTATLIGGEGEGDDRILVPLDLPMEDNSDLNRREMFTDASDVATIVDGEPISIEEYYTQLLQRGYLDLLENGKSEYFEGTVEPEITYTYGVDFFIGDTVQIKNEYGLKGKCQITEVVTSEDSSGHGFFPTFKMV